MVKYFRLYLDGALNRVGDETIFFSLLQNPWHPAQVTDRSDHYSGFNYDLGYLIVASRHFLQLTLGCRRETEQGHLGIFCDGEERKHEAGV